MAQPHSGELVRKDGKYEQKAIAEESPQLEIFAEHPAGKAH